MSRTKVYLMISLFHEDNKDKAISPQNTCQFFPSQIFLNLCCSILETLHIAPKNYTVCKRLVCSLMMKLLIQEGVAQNETYAIHICHASHCTQEAFQKFICN